MRSTNVAIVGAGWAGLTAGIKLAESGVRTSIFEASHTLGGRARKITFNDLTMDNGIHLLSGAYSATLSILNQIRTSADRTNFDRQPFTFNYGSLNISKPSIPLPANKIFSFLFARGITVSEKLIAIKFLRDIQKGKVITEPSETVHYLLSRFRQSKTLIELLWNPICLSALNTDCTRGCALVFLNVISDALLGSRKSSDLIFPTTDLTSLFPSLAERYILTHKGTVNLGERALITKTPNKQFKLNNSDDEFTHIIVATAPHNVKNTFEDPSIIKNTLSIIDQFTYEPIYTIYHQYSKKVSTDHRMIGLNSPYAHWVFDRGITHDEPGLIGVVVSGSGQHQSLTHEELSKRSARVLDEKYGFGHPLWSKVLAEKRATFTCSPQLERPKQITEADGIILAGDYTYERYPAVLEAAVRSGIKASKIILK